MGFRSQIILPKDPSKISNMGFEQRAIAIIRNQIANENKILPYLLQLNESEITSRASKTIHRVDNDSIEVQDKPDFSAQHKDQNLKAAINKSKKHDESKHAIKTMAKNYNFK